MNLRPSGYEPPGEPSRALELDDFLAILWPKLRDLAGRYALAVAKGDPHAHDRGIELATAVLDADANAAESEHDDRSAMG